LFDEKNFFKIIIKYMATNLRVDVGGIPFKSLSRLFIGRSGAREGRKFDIIIIA